MSEEDIWEMEHSARRFPQQAIPMGAIVTASGTGSEMNGGAVITNEDLHLKAGMGGIPSGLCRARSSLYDVCSAHAGALRRL